MAAVEKFGCDYTALYLLRFLLFCVFARCIGPVQFAGSIHLFSGSMTVMSKPPLGLHSSRYQ